MPEPNKCPQCGTPLPTEALAGLCPACLLRLGAAADTVTDARQPPFIPPTVAELAPLFPQLEILELIGKGGMGAVYKARQKQLERIVALKILPPGIGQDAAFAERFMREARALAKLNHPGIVTLYEFGMVTSTITTGAAPPCFFLMEFVDGVNLRQLLHNSRISTREALAIVPQICDALQFAHDQGIVHRDIKPENILLDRRGRVKVADFGLAKIMGGSGNEPAAVGRSAAGSTALTDAGKVMGTPNYMSPEQKENPGEVDHRADIYALGVVFYQMLTGELPGKNIEPPSRKMQIDVRLDEIVLRAMEKDPERRYQQASVLKTQVESMAMDPAKATAQGSTQDPPPPLEPQFQNVLSIAINIIVAILLALLGWAAVAFGIFFNFLYLLILFSVPVLIGLRAGQIFLNALEIRLWKTPFAPDLKKHRWQLLNGWLFWGLSVLTVEVCMVPAQFNSSAYALTQSLLLGGAACLMVLELLPGKRVHLAANLVFACGSIFILGQMAKIYWPVPQSEGVVLSPPIRGEWLIFNGGQSSLINGHYFYHNQQEALDIDRLVNGRVQPDQAGPLESYPSWGETIYAPADGTVTEIENNLDDSPMGQTDTGHPAGNHIVIDIGQGHYVMMAHFQKGSVLVATGDRVHNGEPIAKCGHSGNTSQPHLHIQVQDKPTFSDSAMKTFPIFFRDITCIRGNHQLKDAPFCVRRNDRIIAGTAVEGAASDILPFKTIVLTRATNEVAGVGTGTRTVTVWTDTSLAPDEKLVALIRGIDGQTNQCSSFLFTFWKSAGVGTSTPFDWFLKENEGFGAAEAGAATMQIIENEIKRPLKMQESRPRQVFCVTNHEGGVLTGYIEYNKAVPAPADADGKVMVMVKISRVSNMGSWCSIDYSAKPPSGYRLIATANKGQAQTRSSGSDYDSTWMQIYDRNHAGGTASLNWNVPMQTGNQPASSPPNFPSAPRYLGQQADQFEPFEVILGEPKLIFSITNGPDDISHAFLELAGPTGVGESVDEQRPVVVETFPVSGMRDIQSGEAEIRVRFSKEMADDTWSWSTVWDKSTPEIISGPHYAPDRRTCIVRVKLEPGRTYGYWLNSDQFQNFKDGNGHPAVPYLLIFQTKPK